MLGVWESVVAETKKSQTELVGRFTLGCHPALALFALKDALKELYQSYHGIEIHLMHGLSRVMCEEVISGKIDFALVVNPIRHPDLVIHKLAMDQVGFWRGPKALEKVLIYNPALGQSQALLNKIKKKTTFNRTIESESLEFMSALTATGAGIGILPTRLVKAIAPQLKMDATFPTYLDEITFIHRSDIPKTASTKCVMEIMKSIKL